jgi:hypothetical protein
MALPASAGDAPRAGAAEAEVEAAERPPVRAPSELKQGRVSTVMPKGRPFWETYGPVEISAGRLRAEAPTAGPPLRETALRAALAERAARLAAPTGPGTRADARGPAAQAPVTPGPTVGWEAYGGLNSGGEGSDAQLAVSSTHVVVTARAALAFYTRAGQKVYGVKDGRTFFTSDLGNGIPGFGPNFVIFDMRTIFDEYRKRFWIGALFVDTTAGVADPQSRFVVSVSKSENPLDGFFFYYWDAVPRAASNFTVGDGADYPCMGIGQNTFVQTNKWAGTQYKNWIVQLRDANAMAQGRSQVAGWIFWDIFNPDGSPTYIIQPAVQHGPGTRLYLAEKQGNSAVVWAVDNPLTPSQTLRRGSVSLPGASGGLFDAPQKGQSVAAPPPIAMGPQISDAFLKAAYRGGKLYLSANNSATWGGVPNVSSGRLLRLNVNAFPTLSVEVDRTFGAASAGDPAGSLFYYGWPGIEVNKLGDMGIMTVRSNASIFPELRVSAYLAAESDLRSSVLAKSGEAPYFEGSGRSYNFYAETTGASVDPKDDTGIWLTQQYPTANGGNPNFNNYSMWVARLFGSGDCAHGVCASGAALTSTCDGCVSSICAADPYCCNNFWDGICVGEVASICGGSCN